ncbi:hypothetical protein A3A79_03675 [Candidatus Gottesmanbacteria bacterium RIFCSPLOWO2_01_FULL_43_11b]|uniref:Sortase n=1 Tax=Candidatus Gottesmanbacteria bacterium RIFCSPLOWO2_01_FULL_43_11b TaxID=1798392 RepID=A0A1F6AHP6_9BACT|nr:MAG: hypothetical protein A3A79_03675 [Candidatus Gottesmanbacteria bacterium RIFCSPLOWO2_01_FULL_43_11b]
MPQYQYVKAEPKKRRVKKLGLLPWSLMAAGSFIILWTIWPIASFVFLQQPLLGVTISPLSQKSSVVLGESLDYTDPNTWFPTKPQKKMVAPVNSYQISIPKLNIVNATVIIAGDDLKKSLIHYGGTGLPGQYGTAVIFGHSTLPQFFNPKDYATIFSTLPTLEIDDEILVTYDGITYRYVIFDMTITKPNDLSPLEQRFDDSYITLITCVPPGTYWQRLNVKAKLKKI